LDGHGGQAFVAGRQQHLVVLDQAQALGRERCRDHRHPPGHRLQDLDARAPARPERDDAEMRGGQERRHAFGIFDELDIGQSAQGQHGPRPARTSLASGKAWRMRGNIVRANRPAASTFGG
jgi:hypothetical protein